MRPSAVLDVDRPERSCCRLLCTAKGRVLLRYAAYTLSKRVVVIFAAIALHSSCTALIETEYVGQARSTQLANTFYAVVVTAFAMCVAGRLGRKSTGRFVFELLTEITSWACQQRARGRERTRALTSGGINNEAEDGIEAEDGDDDDEVDDEEALLNLIDWLETIDDVEDANTDDCPTGNVPYTPLSE